MYKVKAARSGRREIVVVKSNGKFVGGASLKFVQWMHNRVPDNLLSTEQIALVKWYEDNRLRDADVSARPLRMDVLSEVTPQHTR